jgi:transposase-like protein
VATKTRAPVKKRTWPDDIKAQIVAEWLTGASARGLSLKHDIPRTTIIGWVDEQDRHLSDISPGTREAFEAKLVQAANALLDASIAFAAKAVAEPLGPAHELFVDRLEAIVRAAAGFGGAIRQVGDPTGPRPEQLPAGDVIEADRSTS